MWMAVEMSRTNNQSTQIPFEKKLVSNYLGEFWAALSIADADLQLKVGTFPTFCAGVIADY